MILVATNIAFYLLCALAVGCVTGWVCAGPRR